VDALVVQDEELYTLEYKTGQPNWKFLAIHNWQAVFYAALAEAKGTIFELIDTSKTKPRVSRKLIEWTPIEKAAILDTAAEIVYNIEAGKRPRRITWECNRCDFDIRCVQDFQGA